MSPICRDNWQRWQNRKILINSIPLFSFVDAESHILFFDIEGLIFELHSEEYAAMSPTTLEVSLNDIKVNSKQRFRAQKLQHKNE